MSVLLAASSALVSGIGAGLSLDRAVVALPAWRRVGVAGWAAFSREADLRNGLVVYPAVGVGSTVLAGITALTAPRGARSAALLAALLAIPPLVATAGAAPRMFSVGSTDDPTMLSASLAGFARWHRLRAAFQLAGFAAAVRALAAIARA